ncbi:MAG: FAD-binding oxidoreductase [Prevotellaceae bacterium]|jgi:D-lactate dehydrogenase|nr:FAD-binding oxidoreductase [Prevotellaceae bacterium]
MNSKQQTAGKPHRTASPASGKVGEGSVGGLFYRRLSQIIPEERLITDPLRLLAFGTDAGFYRLVPKVVVLSHTEEEVVSVIRLCSEMNVPLTFRAAGTSLSGQAISDSVLLVASNRWTHYTVLDEGRKIRLQPGITGAYANRLLASCGRKIGPDPASINAAMIGGIAANNASGMCCGTSQNSYKTVADIRLVFYDGTILDTADPASAAVFCETHSGMICEIEQLRDEVAADPVLTERIKRKYKIKNTTGYSLNALVDYFDPIDIIKHLMIGSEGTLAFISDITYHTVVAEKYKACALMVFATIEQACEVVPVLKTCPVAAVELLDRESMRSVEGDPDAPDYFHTLPETACSLLVEIQSNDAGELARKEAAVRQAVPVTQAIQPYAFTSEPKTYNFNWKARKGLLPSVGGLRKPGTTCLIEDVAFPIHRLAEACIALKELFAKLGYADAVLFGHALEGNFHMVFSQDFSTPAEVERYARLMDELADIVVHRFDGSLKAEHGTGRNMAPYVEKEWGETAYRIMRRIKRLFDPQQLVNPGVLINANPHAHLENLKPLPLTRTLVDKCTECGFCEPVCPSRNLTLTPRKRIVAYRELCRLRDSGQPLGKYYREFISRFDYFGEKTCATDGLCERECPVNINTGKLIKELRTAQAGVWSRRIAAQIAAHMDVLTATLRWMLKIPHAIGKISGYPFIEFCMRTLHRLSGKRFPLWTRYTPTGARRITAVAKPAPAGVPEVVYFPSCINRAMGTSPDYGKQQALTAKTASLLEKAGYHIRYPRAMDKLCCGMAFDSKGFKEQGLQKASELEKALLEASDHGRIPILCDMSPCLYRMQETLDKRLELHEPVSFILHYLKDRLTFVKLPLRVAVHSTCSNTKMNRAADLVALASLCAEEVIAPDVTCCAWAGDRGFFFPELNRAALETLPEQVRGVAAGYSTSRTCEIGLSMITGVSYQSIIYLVDKATS